MKIDSLVIETTRKCNLMCPHCLRGNPQNKNFTPGLLHSFIENSGLTFISSITFSGGEPSLKPDIIDNCLEVFKKHKIEIGNFYIATNGTIYSEEFFITIAKLYSYCSDNEISLVEVSTDHYHEKPNRKMLNLLKAFSFFHLKDNKYNIFINEGNAASNGIGQRELKEDSLDIDEEYIREPVLYLNCNGYVISGCDWSYNNQNKHKISKIEEFDINKLLTYYGKI
jgi:organic radical activating enzyme